MFTCVLCRFDTQLDDIVVARDDGTCVCLACAGRLSGSRLVMGAALRRGVTAAANAIGAA